MLSCGGDWLFVIVAGMVCFGWCLWVAFGVMACWQWLFCCFFDAGLVVYACLRFFLMRCCSVVRARWVGFGGWFVVGVWLTADSRGGWWL